MAEQSIYKLKINEGFKRLIPPLSSAELEQLEENLIHDGCREPLCVWNNTIIDGHNRYEICTRLQIPFTIQRIFFKSYEEATAWICANQLGRRNISDETRKYLIGKRFEMEKLLGAHNAAGTNQHKSKEDRPKMWVEPPFDKSVTRTSERLGEEYRISHATVDKYGIYANALDRLSKVVPEFVPKILSGQIKMSHENVVELSRLSGQDIKRLSQHISDDTAEFVGYSGARKVLPKKPNPEQQIPQIPVATVKDMPAYDPDAEISSLTLTIPSWVSSIDRTRSIANLSGVSVNARSRLENELLGLKDTINIMLAALRR
ncbi:MAG: hypothetical protein GX115_15790 [Ruminiclostridium sp.]|nr:hypothetical protein [Ruminiclostridium sp.]